MFLISRNKRLRMQPKMMILFTMPLLMLFGLVIAIVYPRLDADYSELIRYSIRQSEEQAALFINSHARNMSHIAELISSNSELNAVISDDSFLQFVSNEKSYDEFRSIVNVLSEINNHYTDYRTRIYLPDSKKYGINREFVFPLTDLNRFCDEDELKTRLRSKGEWFLVTKTTDAAPAFSLLYEIRTKDPAFLCVAQIDISLSEIQKILRNANITQSGATYLLDTDNQPVYFSDGADFELIASLGGDKVTSENAERWDGNSYLFVHRLIEPVGWSVAASIPADEILIRTGTMRLLVFVLIACMVVIVLACAYFLSKYYVAKLKLLQANIRQLKSGDLNTRFSHVGNLSTGDEIDQVYDEFNHMTTELRNLLHSHYALGKNAKSLELQLLQAQINPHFLYNTLDLINWMAMDYGAADISMVAQNLAQFYRLTVNKGKNILTIRDELAHAQAYVRIENFHFSDVIHMTTDIPEEIMDYACPNVILQPFIENAIVHGIAKTVEIKECNIHVSAQKEGNDLLLRVEDDGPGISEERLKEILPSTAQIQPAKGFGIRNVHCRLVIYFGEPYGVSLSSVPHHGTTVIIRLPAMQYNEMNEIEAV